MGKRPTANQLEAAIERVAAHYPNGLNIDAIVRASAAALKEKGFNLRNGKWNMVFDANAGQILDGINEGLANPPSNPNDIVGLAAALASREAMKSLPRGLSVKDFMKQYGGAEATFESAIDNLLRSRFKGSVTINEIGGVIPSRPAPTVTRAAETTPKSPTRTVRDDEPPVARPAKPKPASARIVLASAERLAATPVTLTPEPEEETPAVADTAIPAATTVAVPAAEGAETYTVKAGDTLVGIGLGQGLGMQDAIAWALITARVNNIENVDRIAVGQPLQLPTQEQVTALTEAMKAGILADGKISYNAEVRGQNVSKLVPVVPAPTPAPMTLAEADTDRSDTLMMR